MAPRSTPREPLRWANEASVLSSSRYSASLALASASVPPTTGDKPWKKRKSSGSRPIRAACLRTSVTMLDAPRKLRLEVTIKTHSACLAAKARPSVDEPA